jgi:hypothetical protein
MAFANTNYTDILATTIENRSRKIADNVASNNALLARLKSRGKVKPFSGGHKIIQELSFAENANTGWYSGYDLLPVGVSDVISAAEFTIKQAAVPVVISGLEQLQNSGKEAILDLMEGRLSVAEKSMQNLISDGIYSDGTGSGGKEITGLNAAVPVDPSSDTYGNINSATYSFWQNYTYDSTAYTSTTIQEGMNTAWAALVRGADRPDLIVADNTAWKIYLASLQAQQRFTNTDSADAGFPSIKFMDADVILDGGIYSVSSAGTTGAAGTPTGTMFFLNTNYIFFRPHRDRNMVPLSPNRRYATNQDAEVQILAWAGNMTCSGRQFQGRIDFN